VTWVIVAIVVVVVLGAVGVIVRRRAQGAERGQRRLRACTCAGFHRRRGRSAHRRDLLGRGRLAERERGTVFQIKDFRPARQLGVQFAGVDG